MTAVWPLVLPRTEKFVLLALADNANDEGVCWPSIATLCKKTCTSEREVQRAIAALDKSGQLSRIMRAGTSPVYHIHPRHSDTPVTESPPSLRHPTPVTLAPLPRQGGTPTPVTLAPKPSIEPSLNHQGTIKELSASKTKKSKRQIPEGWEPAERTVEELSREFGLRVPEDVNRYVASFRDACMAKGYEYANFDAAFRNCVRQDWPKFRQGKAGAGAKPRFAPERDFKTIDYRAGVKPDGRF